MTTTKKRPPLAWERGEVGALRCQPDQHEVPTQLYPLQVFNTGAPAQENPLNVSILSAPVQLERAPLFSHDPLGPASPSQGCRCTLTAHAAGRLCSVSVPTALHRLVPFACHEETQPATEWGAGAARERFYQFLQK